MLRLNFYILLFILCFDNVLKVHCGYGIGYSRGTGNQEMSDVGLPQHMPPMFKSKDYSSMSYNVKSLGVKSGVKTGKSPGTSGRDDRDLFTSRESYKGDCPRPQAPVNTRMVCSMYSGCRITCNPNYKFDDGESNHVLTCEDGRWIVQGWPSMPNCSPICLPQCQHNGICIAPGQCECPENYSGPQCQFEKKPCLNTPMLPMNSKRSCSSTSCSIACMKGYQFPDGSSITNLICKEGNWMPSRSDMSTVPDCQPICEPPCLNGGNCLSLNVCQCPQDFRGPQCQYPSSACAVANLGFNGGYNCSGSNDMLSCTLSCPVGINFDSPAASLYTCQYANGIFLPQPVPQCVYGDHIITMGGSSQVFYKTKNYTDINEKLIMKNTKNLGGWSHSLTMGGTYGASGQYDDRIHFIDPDLINKHIKAVENHRPKPGVCFTWGGSHFKTFDGKVYSFNSPCRHILVRDSEDSTFTIAIQNFAGKRRISIFLQDKEFTLEGTEDEGVIFKSSKRLLPIPAQLPGIRAQMAGHKVEIVLEAVSLKLKWDTKQLVEVDVTESLWQRTEGLCGKIDGHASNDVATKEGLVPKSLVTLADSWKMKKVGEADVCEETPSEQHACSPQPKSIVDRAEKFCSNLVSKPQFAACNKIINISLLLESCKWDYCGCPPQQSREECGCNSIAVYAGQCASHGIKTLAKWRDENTCMMNCTGGRIYQWCGPAIQPCCGSPTNLAAPESHLPSDDETVCNEGCFCPPGTLFHEGHCVTKDRCPCRLRGKMFPPGASVPKDCNTCTCQDGEWVCTQVSCGARCSAIGDPHYETFDGKRFNFMGQCSYYLMKGDNYSIEGENVACSGAISEAMNLPSSDDVYDLPSCTKALTIRYGGVILQLKQGKAVVVNGKDVAKLPAQANGIRIKLVSSLFIRVKLPNGIQIWWDGLTRAHIDAPAKLRGKTKGLCGTFNSNQKDDFLTPEGDVEQAIAPFANKWKTGEKCNDLSDKEDPNPCDVNVQNKPTAEKLCAKLKSSLFEECHWIVDMTPFYEDCMYDMCACEGDVDRCLCPILGAYATECARQGVHIQWRLNVKECEIHCPGGQTYQVCGDSCARTCNDISTSWEDSQDASEEARCHPTCVEGCNCPPGQALDDKGECIPHASCPCHHSSMQFPTMYKEVRPGRKELELCVCNGAKWECKPASPEDILKYPRAEDIKTKCSATRNEEFTTCEPAEPLTCKNMHKPPLESSVAECHPGCQCKKGYVLESITKLCVKPEECPCHHGSRSYADGETMQEDCNTCKCNSGTWSCDKRVCAAVCSAWGDSHFHTFDGKVYDFQGVCTYLLAKGSHDSQEGGFSIEIQNEVCGTSGVTCSKAVTLKVGSPDTESVTFTKDKPLPNIKNLKLIKIRNAGLFVFAEVPSLNLVLQWDKGTRVYVKVDPKWKGRLKGLCGNYNDNEADDFQTPSGGVSETSAMLFGDSWKLQQSCPPATEIVDTCAIHPERRTWALQRCGAIKRAPFTACHSEVPPGPYLTRCERDTCACGFGGDCECLCTALAAYAHECASRGVPIKWRSQEMCPMQCDETCSNYSPCISTCPIETCDNTLTYAQITHMCPQDTCVEGCQKKKVCPQGEVMSNSTLDVCVPRSMCKPTCLTLPDGKVILEGELMEEDQCHSCYCSRGTKVCKGAPCSTLPPPTTTVPSVHLMEQKSKCKSGWSEWISQSVPQHIKEGRKSSKSSKTYSVEQEKLPSLLILNNMIGGYCTADQMISIECRTVGDHKTAKESGCDAECNLDKGLFCRQTQDKPCPDFEIRVECSCEEATTEGREMCDGVYLLPDKYDCSKFYECAPGMGSPDLPDYVRKSCGADLLFDTVAGECTWPQKVLDMRPECKEQPTTLEYIFIETTPITYPKTMFEEWTTPYTMLTKEYLQVFPSSTHRPSVESHLECDPGKPNVEHETDCALFYHCAPGMGPLEHPNVVIKSCGPSMLYNPVHMICDWPQNVIALKPDCGVGPVATTEHFVISKCEKGKVWSDCAINCLQVCDYYGYYLQKEGKCSRGEVCIAGCIDEFIAKTPCKKGYFWRDVKTCVKESDCTCHTYYGKLVKPGEVINISDCEFCQCLDNQLVCDTSACASTRPPKTTTVKEVQKQQHVDVIMNEKIQQRVSIATKAPIIRPSTLSPPPECSPERYTNVIWDDTPLGDQAFSASSSLGHSFEPQHSKLNGKVSETSGGSWSPKESQKNEFIQVKLDHKEPLYGIILQGSPLFDQYITSYEVVYSDDGNHYHPVLGKNGKPEIFRGPVDNQTPMKQMFLKPFEAQYVKILPKTWHDTIAIRFELVGCGVITTTTSEPTTTPLPKLRKKMTKLKLCTPPLELTTLTVKNIVASSSKNYKTVLPHDEFWQPLTNSPKEWIQFDFGEDRKIYGVVTNGGPNGWVSAYVVKYSTDAVNWNPIVDEDKEIKMFGGNFDSKTPVNVTFDKPLHARYLKIIPSKWHNNIQLKVKPQGCDEPEKQMESVILHELPEEEVSIQKVACFPCPGVTVPEHGCKCTYPKAFDGNQCLPIANCPCIVGHIPYQVGATYVTEKCEKCTCTLGGEPVCEKQQCPKCKKGLVRVVSPSCDCLCEPCPKGKLPCPTSDICIPEASWCDGLQDCPDDEVGCTTTPIPTTTEVAEIEEKKCPVPTCPKGYKVVEKKPSYKHLELMSDGQVTSDSLFAQPSKSSRKGYQKYFKGGGVKTSPNAPNKGGVKSSIYQTAKVSMHRPALELPKKAEPSAKIECIEWRCVSSRPPPALPVGGIKPTLPPCPAPKCPPGYTISIDNDEVDEYDCPKYSCAPPPRRDAVCNITCRIFNTFDGTEFQYDICNHILARDADQNTWDITLQKNCTKKVCVNELLISQESDQVRFRPDLTVEYNGYHYTVDQTRKIGFQTQTFAISRLGGTLFYISTKYGFYVMYDDKRNIRVGVAGKLYGRVDGLCGFFNEDASDDRRKPDGSPAQSTEEFGDSWAHKESPEVCEAVACPINLQNEAWEMCKSINSKIFSGCSSSIDLEKSRARCLETVCECMQNKQQAVNATKSVQQQIGKTCLCESLQSFVTECQAADQVVNLQGWRTEMNCPVSCPVPLVHYDCFRRQCEISCSNLKDDDPCPTTPGVCFSGCFCPEGLVKKGSYCVPPTECRDCVCDGYGKPQYVTYDRRNFTFNGNCTYIASRDKTKDGKHDFEVFITNGECPNDPEGICTVALHVVHDGHVLHIQKTNDVEFDVIIDGLKVQYFPVTKKWLQLQLVSGKDISLLIPSVQLEVSSIFHNMAFTIRVPSMLYSDKMEGLCGNCDGDLDNDLGTSDEAVRKFGLGWRAPQKVLNNLDIHEENCVEKPANECWPLPPDQDPCFKIMDNHKFGKCHPVVDPTPFLVSCQQDLCSTTKQLGLCVGLETYARECARAGICLDWRRDDFCPYKCEEGFVYKTCGLGCQITCENYQNYTKTPSLCNKPKTEGCFCPTGKVPVNGKCIEHHKCFPCDDHGHYMGDSWNVDECTTCSCGKRGGVVCIERSCATVMVCPEGQVEQKIAKVPGQCCPEFICVPKPTEAMVPCDEPIKIECGFGQVMKLETAGVKCPTFTCQCKPLDECDVIPPLNKTKKEPGMERIIDKSGCCPQAQFVCKPETCPKPPECPKYHKPKPYHKEKVCCPQYTCEPPSDKCLYDMEYESSPTGGEIKRKQSNLETVPKDLGAQWLDGPCRTCVCKKIGGSTIDVTNAKTSLTKNSLRAVCSVTMCPQIPVSDDFVIVSQGVPFNCCPEPNYTACKYNGKEYKVGEEWKSSTNPCVSYLCALKDDGTLEKKTNTKQCDKKCKQGWRYVEPTKFNQTCCGDCVPYACIANGVERKIGEEWTSQDHCTNYFCLNKNGTLQVQAASVSCPLIGDSMKEDFEFEMIPQKGQCCKKIKAVACKVGNKVYAEGNVWRSDVDPCLNYTCTLKDDGTLEKQSTVQHCEEKCKKGFKYIPPAYPNKICCGECVPYACLVSDVEHPIGEEWTSTDHCTKYTCLNKTGTLQVQSSKVPCPSLTKAMKEEFQYEEIPLPGQCCKKLQQVACRVDGELYKVGETWKSKTDPCTTFKCLEKGDKVLEKQSSVKQCDKKCKKGWKYNPSPSPEVCCGECVPVACVVGDKEYNIGQEWTSKDHCTNYFCLNKNGTLQVEGVTVSCPSVPATMEDEFVIERIPVHGQCCKKITAVACKVNNEIYKEGSMWHSTDGDPCKNVTCTRDNNNELVKTESLESCTTDCPMGWEYRPSNDPKICCGVCVQTACAVNDTLYKPDEVWYTPDKCTTFNCDHQGEHLVVSAQQESCPDVSACNPKNIYTKGCCRHCNITALAQKSCISKDLPAQQTVGLVHEVKHPHGDCRNFKALNGFKECNGACDSGTKYNEEFAIHDTDCKCCQAAKYAGLIVEMKCEDGYLYKKQVAVPSVCECLACVSESQRSTSTKTGRKIPMRSRVAFSPEDVNLDDVELINAKELGSS